MSKRISPLPTEKSLTIKPPSQPDFKYDLIQSGVANCAALQSKLLCSFLSNWAGGPFITFIFKLIAPFYEMLAEFITELKNIVRLLFILPGTGLVWPVWLQYIPQRAIPYSAHTRRIKSALVEYTEKRPNKLFRWALNICNYLWPGEVWWMNWITKGKLA